MKLDILAIGAHPDDVEIGCSGTLMKQIDKGHKVGVLDLTKGELGTRGDAETRMRELRAASKIMQLHVRETFDFEDGFFVNDKEHQLQIIRIIRQYQPTIVICNATYDRHPDHGRSASVVRDACFISGLKKVETELNGKAQEAFRPVAIYNYIQALHQEPDFVVDITDYFERKMESVRAYKSQFYDPESKEPDTFISKPGFIDFIKGRALHYGIPAGVKYAEGFTVNRTPMVDDILHLQ